jgi:hypothetical protein
MFRGLWFIAAAAPGSLTTHLKLLAHQAQTSWTRLRACRRHFAPRPLRYAALRRAPRARARSAHARRARRALH